MKTGTGRTAIAWLMCMILTLAGCAGPEGEQPQEPSRQTRVDLLGTVISITVYDQLDQAIFDEAFSIVAGVDALMSTNREDSEVVAISAHSGKEPVAVSEETYALIERAVGFSQLCDGAFAITIGAVMQLWKQDETFAVRPADAEIANRLPLVNYQDVILSEAGVMLAREGMALDLGAIAKGYACDKVLEYLQSQGVTAALLDFGGNIHVYGAKPDGAAWKLGIRSPIIGENGLICTVELKESKSIVTSGGYERYFEQDGTTYHHLLDPKTGYPADSGVISVTIIDPSSARADALSTACFVLGAEKGMGLLATLPESEGIFVLEDHSIIITPGLQGIVTLTDDRFELK